MSGNVAPASSCCSLQGCCNAIAHKVYAVQQSICGLCSTDTKVHTLFVIGRVLQAAAIATFVGAIACAPLISPVALVGIIPAALLGLIGTYFADEHQKIYFQCMDQCVLPRPFVAGQPIGIVNTGNTCWLNTSLQLLTNIPAYRERLQQIPVFAQFLAQYDAANQNMQKVASGIDGNALRQFLSAATGGQIRPTAEQEDAAQFFEYLFQGPHALYQLQQQLNGGAPTIRPEPMIQIQLPIGPQQQRSELQQLFNNYFDYASEIGQRFQLFFPQVPDNLLIQAKRFYQYLDQNGALQQGKINEPITIPPQLTLPHQFVRGGTSDTQYLPNGFLIHCGATPEVGHYVAYIKRGSTWWYCSDHVVYEVTERDALAQMAYADIISFSKRI